MSYLFGFLLLLPSVLGPPIDETGTASILWAQNGAGHVYMADLATGNRALVADTGFYLDGLVADIQSQTVFWNESSSSILRAGWNGTNIEQVYQISSMTVGGLAVDPRGPYLYWGESDYDGHTERGGIWRSNLDGSGAESVFHAVDVAPMAICIDQNSDKVYWADNGSPPTIKRANLDGTGIETIINLGFQGRSVAISPDSTQLYYVDYGHGVFRSNLDGSNTQFLFTINGGTDLSPLSIAFSLDGMTLYTGTSNAIWRSNLEGSDLQRFITDTGFVQAMSIVPEPASGIGCCALTLSLFSARRRHFVIRF
jgi:sugar lactone lactonase YvrE